MQMLSTSFLLDFFFNGNLFLSQNKNIQIAFTSFFFSELHDINSQFWEENKLWKVDAPSTELKA